MSAEDTRPRLLFLRWVKPGQPPFLLHQLGEHVATLQQFFDVVVVDRAGDYDELCDRHQPDLALFESGIYAGPQRSLVNTHRHPQVPKLGFLNADAFDPVRATFVADMDDWGVRHYLTVSVSMADYTPELADRLYCWPNAIDPTVHRDHGLPKTVPVLLTGSKARHYPWRNEVSRLLAQHHPTLSMPHFGWADSDQSRRMAVGEDYARLINAARLAPTCGSFTRDLVRKHLEIPGSRTCLVTQRSAALEAAGFVDMRTCVFAEPHDVLDKVATVLADPDLLTSITDAGHSLVHGRHTLVHRRQVRDWYDLWTQHGSADHIVQENPTGPLTWRPPARRPRERIVVPAAEDRRLLAEGWAAVEEGRHGTARRAFERASNFHYQPEAEVGRCWSLLLTGRPGRAQATIDALLDHAVQHSAAVRPDPVQWSLHLRALLCRGRLPQATREAARFPDLGHPELARTRWAIQRINGSTPPQVPGSRVVSVNPLPEVSWDRWQDELEAMVRAGHHPLLARRLRRLRSADDPARRAVRRPSRIRTGTLRVVPADRQSEPVPAPRRRFEVAGAVVGWARRRVGQEWLDAMAEYVEREPLDRVVVARTGPAGVRERSMRRAVARNPRLPSVTRVAPDGVALASVDRHTLVFLARGVEPHPSWLPLLSCARVVCLDGLAGPRRAGLVDELVEGRFELTAHESSPERDFAVLRHDLREASWAPRVVIDPGCG